MSVFSNSKLLFKVYCSFTIVRQLYSAVQLPCGSAAQEKENRPDPAYWTRPVFHRVKWLESARLEFSHCLHGLNIA